LELPAVARRRLLALLLAAFVLLAPAILAASARAASDTPVLVTELNKAPAGYRLTALQVRRIAQTSPVTRDELRRHPRATPYEYTKGSGEWQVSWFAPGRGSKELLQVYVDDATGSVTQAWTGFQVAWSMARGYPGAFGRNVNAWYVWIPLCILFVAPFLRRRPTLLHLDLLMMLGFSVSLALFNHAEVGLSVPLIYPFMLYLLVRMLLLAAGRGRPREPLRLIVRTSWLAVGLVFLVGFRVGLNIANSNVIDVGYAGVIGAHKVVHGQNLYGHWPADNASGDTYGPVNYYAYVPFLAVFGWSGKWDSLPAAHAAAIAFDLLTMLALFVLGRRIRGPTLGVMLAYAWAAYPFTLWSLNSNTNDTLVALLVVAALLVITSAPARGFLGALAGLTKFAPLALAPLLARGVGDSMPRKRSLLAYVLVYAATVALVMLPVLLDHNLHPFWQDTISYQAKRTSPFTIWGLWGGLGVEQHLAEGAVIALALAVAVLPRRRGVLEVAALGAAVLIAIQMVANYWLYSYIVWFFPLVIVALFGAYPSRLGWALEAEERSWEQRPALAGV
jgi:hypothetical protein